MNDSLAAGIAAPRILIEADLKPLQGARFQPTGFPSLGAAEFRTPHDVAMLLVESPQSMANRLENVSWDDATDDLVSVLDGLPYVTTTLPDGRTTDSIREAHRVNSPYLSAIHPAIQERAGIAGKKSKGGKSDGEKSDESSGTDIRKLASAVFYYDPNSVLHGVFLEKIVGTARLTRALSGFVEAEDVRPVESGGVKNDRLDPKGTAKGGAEKGFGNVPFSRTEYTAKRIVAYFSLDVALIDSYGLGDIAKTLLVAIGLWKIRRVLEVGMRFRTACDFEVEDLRVTRPAGWELPSVAELEQIIRTQLAACKAGGLIAEPAKTAVAYQQ